MNVLDAYIKEYRYLNIVLTSVDYKLVKKVALNLSKDFGSEVIDLFPLVENLKDIDSNRVKELMQINNAIKIIISPIFPTAKTSYEPNSYMNEITKKALPYHLKIHNINGGNENKITNSTRLPLDFSNGILKVKATMHINLSLNKKLLEERKIPSKLIDQEFVYKNFSKVNKYLNISKYKNHIEIEDDIFNFIIKKVQGKLEKGKYLERIKEINTSEETSESINTSEETSESINTSDIESEKTDISDMEDSEFSEKIIGKKYDHDKKEKYLEKKNRKIDDDIMADVDISDEVTDPLDIINFNSEVDDDDINLDTEIENNMLDKNIILGSRKIGKKIAVIGNRKLKKKMK